MGKRANKPVVQPSAHIGFLPPGASKSTAQGDRKPNRKAAKTKLQDTFGYRFEEQFPVPSRISRVNASLVEAVNDFHFAMMNDTSRNEFYYSMLKKHITPETGVLEIGAGSGLLSIMAGKLGAKWVVAVEGSEEMSRLARENVAENHLEEKIKVLNKLSTELNLSDLPGKPNILVSEIFGTLLLGESALDYIADVRDRGILEENAVILPQLAEQYAVPIECETLESLSRASSWEDIQLSHVLRLQDTVSTVFTKQYGFRLNGVPFRYLSSPVKLLEIDFSKDSHHMFPIELPIDITPTGTGKAHAWLYFWKAHHPDCPGSISTAPEDTLNNFPRDMQWGQALQLIEAHPQASGAPALLEMKEGEPVSFRCYFSMDRVLMTIQRLPPHLDAKRKLNEAKKLQESNPAGEGNH